MDAKPKAFHHFTTRFIGKGSYGAVFTATPLGQRTPTMVIKRFMRQFSQDEESYLRDVYSEFYASSYLLVKGERELCADLAACALWFEIGTTFAHIGFPYTDAIRLGAARKSADVQNTLLFIVNKMMRGLAMIHETGVIHSDVKLENLIVERSASSGLVGRVSGVRIIDFGIACSESPDVRRFFERIVVPGENEKFLRCFRDEAEHIYYHTTTLYQDPLSLENGDFKTFTRSRDAQLAFLKFDLYAAACVVTYLFDPQQYAQRMSSEYIDKIKIRATSYMPAWKITAGSGGSLDTSRDSSSSSGDSYAENMAEDEEESCDSCAYLVDVLIEMTGPLNQRKSAVVYAGKFDELFALFYNQMRATLKK